MAIPGYIICVCRRTFANVTSVHTRSSKDKDGGLILVQPDITLLEPCLSLRDEHLSGSAARGKERS